MDDGSVDSLLPPRVKSGGEPPPDTATESDERPVRTGSRPKRGELRIYLGAAPGVGKTFAMLGEAHRRLERGTDLVAAVVETHGRAKTAELLEGVAIIPPRYIEYRGSRFAELDVPAVLARCPQVVLVDELAHTNTPGSKNPKRWMDVEELLDAGISVISTVNVQHLESLNDVVAQITGIEQQETVPDEIVRGAAQIELVDITPEALRRRLSHGNVYAAEKVDAALSNYFRRGNLTALRELALLWLADQVDAALAKYRADNKITATWEARERVLTVVANKAASLVRQRDLAAEAGRAEAIGKADELRRSLLSAVSHDLRTPLAGAKAAVSSLRSEDVGFSEEDTAELLATVEESIDALTALVDNLLDSSRLAAGAVRPHVSRVYLEEVVQRALLGIGRGATGAGTAGLDRVKVDVGDAVAMADAGLLERVLANLIDNALRYAPDSLVRVNAGRVGRHVLINVVDEGPGVPRFSEEQLFEPFQRLGDRVNRSGVGLGLSVARGFVNAMGGAISATDTPGGGLTFVIELAAPQDES